MKPSKNPAKSATKARTPLDRHQFPLTAQTDATPSRDEVRAVAHPVTAPRQTSRRTERTQKRQTGI
jgi:hypothetical protein